MIRSHRALVGFDSSCTPLGARDSFAASIRRKPVTLFGEKSGAAPATVREEAAATATGDYSLGRRLRPTTPSQDTLLSAWTTRIRRVRRRNGDLGWQIRALQQPNGPTAEHLPSPPPAWLFSWVCFSFSRWALRSLRSSTMPRMTAGIPFRFPVTE